MQERARRAGAQVLERSGSEIIVPAAHPEVGELTVRSDPAGLMVSIGGRFHQHFDGNSTATEDAAVAFLTDFLSDRCIITAAYAGRQLIWSRLDNLRTGGRSFLIWPRPAKGGGWLRLLRRLWPPKTFTRSFVWTGPVVNQEHVRHDPKGEQLFHRLGDLDPSQAEQLVDYLSSTAGMEGRPGGEDRPHDSDKPMDRGG